jgi:hypothetical protein
MRLRLPIRSVIWACLLAIFSPKRFLEFQEGKKNLGIMAASDNNSVLVVSHAFWISLVLVLSSGLLGAVIGVVCGRLFGAASAQTISCFQVGGACLLLWGTLFVRGWQIQTYKGQTLIERVNQWLYRALYCLGTVILVASLTWPRA